MTQGASLLVVIVGSGRLGSFLANRLSGKGHRVIVVDAREVAFQKLSIEFSGRRVLGNATEFSVLKRAQVDRADVVLAVTHDDNVNMMVAQVARDVLGVGTVVARVSDPGKEPIYHGLSIETVCPTTLAGASFLERLTLLGTDGPGP
jgi:trk system potassium uptake protein TrkA